MFTRNHRVIGPSGYLIGLTAATSRSDKTKAKMRAKETDASTSLIGNQMDCNNWKENHGRTAQVMPATRAELQGEPGI